MVLRKESLKSLRKKMFMSLKRNIFKLVQLCNFRKIYIKYIKSIMLTTDIVLFMYHLTKYSVICNMYHFVKITQRQKYIVL